MKLVPTNRTDYGLRALIYLVNAGSQWTKAAEIGSVMVIPVGFLQIVLQDLQRSKLVTSRVRPEGRLRARTAARINHRLRGCRVPRGTARCR